MDFKARYYRPGVNLDHLGFDFKFTQAKFKQLAHGLQLIDAVALLVRVPANHEFETRQFVFGFAWTLAQFRRGRVVAQVFGTEFRDWNLVQTRFGQTRLGRMRLDSFVQIKGWVVADCLVFPVQVGFDALSRLTGFRRELAAQQVADLGRRFNV